MARRTQSRSPVEAGLLTCQLSYQTVPCYAVIHRWSQPSYVLHLTQEGHVLSDMWLWSCWYFNIYNLYLLPVIGGVLLPACVQQCKICFWCDTFCCFPIIASLRVLSVLLSCTLLPLWRCVEAISDGSQLRPSGEVTASRGWTLDHSAVCNVHWHITNHCSYQRFAILINFNHYPCLCSADSKPCFLKTVFNETNICIMISTRQYTWELL